MASDNHRRANSVSPLRKATIMDSEVNFKHQSSANTREASPRPDAGLLKDFQNLSKLNLKLEDKITAFQSESNRYRILYEQNEKELKIQKMTNTKLQE